MNQYKEGWKAFPSKECPYKKGTYKFRRWWDGWHDCNNDPARLSEAGESFQLAQYY